MKYKSIYKLELHEEATFNAPINHYAMRVPGGWIYTVKAWGNNYQSVFVPYNDEFKDQDKEDWLDSQNFYEMMQTYRHAKDYKVGGMMTATEAFEQVKKRLRGWKQKKEKEE